MFELARDYAQSGMSAYSQLQQREFAMAERNGYGAVKHQRFVGTGYFDSVATVISSGQTSTCALAGSTEAEQFDKHTSNGHSADGHNGHSAYTNGNGGAPAAMMERFDEDEVALMPSGD
jgi:isocitrate lyase family protein